MKLKFFMFTALSLLPLQVQAATDPEHYTNVAISTHIFKPHELPAPDLKQLKVPEGFQISKFAEDVGNARILAVSPQGRIYVTRRDTGDVLMFNDPNNTIPTRVASRAGLHGITFHQGKVYLATVHEIFRADVKPDGSFGPLEMIIHDLPDAGQHNTRTVQVGPDNMLYIGVGSTCNECAESSHESATILRASLDGKSRSVFAAGLRDAIGWGWHPLTGEMWEMDHGIDWMDDEMPEELNKLEKGKHYGWPYLYADNKINPRLDPAGGLSKSEWLKTAVPMVLGYDGHSAPMQMSFYNGSQFPKEYAGDAFVSMRGSWNRREPKGYEVIRVKFKDGKAVGFEPFVTGFITPQGEHGRPTGNAIAKDGSLLFTDDRNGIIYRVSYIGNAERATPVKVPATAMESQAALGANVPLALKRLKPAARLNVTSTAFNNGGAIPAAYSQYEQGNSFPLAWSGAPTNTKSYVIIMEDPDSKKPPIPVVHWVAWNIPAETESLRSGLHKQYRLPDPKDMNQGATTPGSIGYYGPKPPEGDPAHHYHTQVFALDTMLDLPPGADRDKVLAAMEGHILAGGELIGTFKRPATPTKP